MGRGRILASQSNWQCMRMDDSPSLLVTNGLVRTLWQDRPIAEAVLMNAGRVAWVGFNRDAPQADVTLDARGQVVLPGLIDAHTHLLWQALDRIHPDFGESAVSGISQLLEKLHAVALERNQDEWILARGLNEHRLREKRLPTREELDSASRGKPVVLKRVCGHAVVANSRALQLLGVEPSSADPPGGIIERHAGRPNGVLREAAAAIALRRIPLPPACEVIESMDAVARDYLACGVTGVTEAAVGFSSTFSDEWSIWETVRKTAGFPLRMAFMFRISPDEARSLELRPTAANLDWQANTLKFFADGTFSNLSAKVLEPYTSMHSCCRGLFIQSTDTLLHYMTTAASDGWGVAVHAIGDEAIDLLATQFKKIRTRYPRVALRVEHLAMPSAEALQLLKEVEASIVPQYAFLHELGDGFVRAIGVDRAEHVYPGRSLHDRSFTVAGSSDAPASSMSPFAGMAAAMDRATSTGRVLNAAERLRGHEALSMYTRGSARILGHEGCRGVLKPGAVADAVIVDADPCSASATALREAQISVTISRGQVAYKRA
jgi:predicted amidohydrolase YtcJ